MALQAPGQHHLGAMLCTNLEGQCCLSMHLICQAVHQRLRSTRLDGALESQNLQVLISALQEEFCLCCCPVWFRREVNPTKSLQDLRNAQQDLLHAEGLPVHSPDQVPIHVLEDDDSYFAPQGLSLVDPVFFPCQGLVLSDVQDHRGIA